MYPVANSGAGVSIGLSMGLLGPGLVGEAGLLATGETVQVIFRICTSVQEYEPGWKPV